MNATLPVRRTERTKIFSKDDEPRVAWYRDPKFEAKANQRECAQDMTFSPSESLRHPRDKASAKATIKATIATMAQVWPRKGSVKVVQVNSWDSGFRITKPIL